MEEKKYKIDLIDSDAKQLGCFYIFCRFMFPVIVYFVVAYIIYKYLANNSIIPPFDSGLESQTIDIQGGFFDLF